MSESPAIEDAIKLGVKHHTAGQFQQAEKWYRHVLAQTPDHPEVLHLLGTLAYQMGQFEIAVELFSRASVLRPDNIDYQNNLGESARKAGLLGQAETAFRRAIELSPVFAAAHANLGLVLQEQGKLDEAEAENRRALELDPNFIDATTNLAAILRSRGDLDGAIELHRRAIAIAPNHAASHNNLATALEAKDLLAEAQAEYQIASELAPRAFEPLNNLSEVLRRQCKRIESIECLKRLVEVIPGHPEAHWNLALAYLSVGDFVKGWPLYEWRFKCEPTWQFWREYLAPRWDGTTDLTGKTIYLYPEQGYGDMIQFARFIAPLARRGAKVVLQCHDELVELMKGVDGVSKVIGLGEGPPKFDTYQALLSLPWVLKTKLENLPSTAPYIQVDSKRREHWARRLTGAASQSPRKIGIVWAGRPTHKEDAQRSIPLNLFGSIFQQFPEIAWFSLQKGEAANQLNPKMPLVDLGNELNDFADTAAAIENLDLLISVDTAAAHLAGALGKPVWMLLPFAADFRWMQQCEDSPWYPSMRLFRQSQRNDWAGVIQRIWEELAKLT